MKPLGFSLDEMVELLDVADRLAYLARRLDMADELITLLAAL